MNDKTEHKPCLLVCASLTVAVMLFNVFLFVSNHPVILYLYSFISVSVVWCWIQDFYLGFQPWKAFFCLTGRMLHEEYIFTVSFQLKIQQQASETFFSFALLSDIQPFFCLTVFTVGLSLWFNKDIPNKTSCMSRLSNLYTESVKKLRSPLFSKSCCVRIYPSLYHISLL